MILVVFQSECYFYQFILDKTIWKFYLHDSRRIREECMLSWDVRVQPFKFLQAQECAVYKENGLIIAAKFALKVMDEENHYLKEGLGSKHLEVSIDEDYSKAEIEEIWVALKEFDVTTAEQALRVNGITDALSIYQMKKMECFLPILLRAYDDAREEIFSQLPFYHTMKRLHVDDLLESLKRLERQGFFRSWDRAILYRTVKRQRIICKGTLNRLTLRKRQNGKVLAGAIDADGKTPVSEIGVPALEIAPDGWVNLMRICRLAAAHAPVFFD